MVAGVLESVTVTADDGKAYKARVVAFDPDVDVAVLYVPDLSVPALRITEAPPGGRRAAGPSRGFALPAEELLPINQGRE
ncbi:trypsin-like peptidase domain-containing protein [Nonomuraea sp. NPDC049750]|uniref:trypsin-like peptidase domain-containing protein n=1 Tax=Nonomuraea sp. NPDC049750 TaxID=3154738 RepID=UPI0033FAF71B